MKSENKLIGAGLLTAITASLCCITPVLALIVGTSGIASTFSWIEPFRPFLIGLTIVVLGFAWFQKLKSRTEEEIACACEENEKPSFWSSHKFLGIVTVFSVVMLAFPFYADALYPEPILSESENVNLESTYEINITGMTCTGCEEHVKLEMGKLRGISGLEVSYDLGNAVVTFDESKTDIEQVKSAVDKIGYKVESVNKSK